MIRHVVLMRFRADSPPAALAAAVEGLASLSQQIPEVLAMSPGLNLGLTADGCDLAIVVDFASPADYLAYANHPEHHRVVRELIDPWVVDRHRAQIDLPD